MKKKKYIQPSMVNHKLRISQILTGSDGKLRIVPGEEAEIIGADEEKRTDDYWGGGDAM